MKAFARIKLNKETKEYSLQNGEIGGNHIVETLGKFYTVLGYKQVDKFDDTENTYRGNLDSSQNVSRTLTSRL